MKTEQVYDPEMGRRCTAEYLTEKLKEQDIEFVSAELNDTGVYSEPGLLFGFIQHTEEKDLPAYYRVVVRKKMTGGRTAKITVHLPLVWNERFFGVTGGGSATFMDYQQYQFASSTPWTLAVRNHFACAETDCSFGFDNYTWGMKDDSNDPDWDLLKDWGYNAAHDVAVAGKLVASLVYGREPEYSYIAGLSAGGRTVHGEVQRFPMDYDGAWAQCAAVPWIPHLMSQSWPYFVMHHENHPLSRAKLEAFYQGVLKKYDCEEKGYVDNCYYPELDPFTLVGTQTLSGTITEDDAKIMQMIYDGPRYADGRAMAKCDAMGCNIRYASFVAYDADGEIPTGVLSPTALQGFRWIFRNRQLDFSDISREDFDRMYNIAVSQYKDLDNQDPDISAFRDKGGKLILTHATSDQCVPVATTLKYYNDLRRYADSEDALKEYAACFISRGGGHGGPSDVGELMSYPDIWASLMRWVEDGIAPEEVPTQTWDKTAMKVVYSGNSEKRL